MKVVGEVKLNTVRVRTEEYYGYENQNYVNNPIQSETPVIEGYFQRENTVKEMAIRRVNRTLCGILGLLVCVAFVSYYFSMTNELTLNTLSRQITTLNEENAELQNNLDRLKSFNNVDTKVAQNSLLQKAAKVIEVQAVKQAVVAPSDTFKKTSQEFNWSIGY